MKQDKYSRPVPLLDLYIQEPPTTAEMEAQELLEKLLRDVERDKDDLEVIRMETPSEPTPLLNASGALFVGLDAIAQFACEERVRHEQWLATYPHVVRVRNFRNPYASIR